MSSTAKNVRTLVRHFLSQGNNGGQSVLWKIILLYPRINQPPLLFNVRKTPHLRPKKRPMGPSCKVILWQTENRTIFSKDNHINV